MDYKLHTGSKLDGGKRVAKRTTFITGCAIIGACGRVFFLCCAWESVCWCCP